ncbi:SRPBCC family protein [Naasia sp. SYSU D00057]|uniref:SRPBCC family protein n=1 Tax=Naasia sp. SYSU D00057 TaxID=2817380 RepID=UPI001B316C8B|nr:SRPBCC family protein [Naasia sp. SYSU D00057]
MTTTTVRRRIAAPPHRVYAALLDPDTIARWRVPAEMSCVVHEFEPREGGRVHVSLTYDSADAVGKTTEHTDTYRGRLVRLVPDRELVEVDEFDTDDPALRGEMTMTFTLAEAGDATELSVVHRGVPAGVSAADNEQGWNESLDRLAALVEEQQAQP